MLNLSDMLAPDRVSFETGIGSQKQAFERLAELLSTAVDQPQARLVAALAEREKLGTTGFGDGIAIPHGRIPGICGTTAAFLCLADPIDWQAVDGRPVDLMVGMVTDSDAGASHLQALALVGRTLRDRQFVAKLRGAANADALWAILDMAGKKAA